MLQAQETAREMYERMRGKLADVVPEVELRYKSELAWRIATLKRERNAVVLGHNYMEPALYNSIPDFTGDSLELCRQAARTTADIIVFCGVRFMAETAKTLTPGRTVLIPSPVAGCSLAQSITAADVRELKAKVVQSLAAGPVIFISDEFLARNVARETGRAIIFPTRGPRSESSRAEGLDYQMVGWQGRCEVREKFTVEDIANVRRQFPDVVVLAHPECSPEVVAASDFSAAANPRKEMLRLCTVRCPHMNEITLEMTLAALEQTRYVVEVPEDIRRRALAAVERMIAIG